MPLALLSRVETIVGPAAALPDLVDCWVTVPDVPLVARSFILSESNALILIEVVSMLPSYAFY